MSGIPAFATPIAWTIHSERVQGDFHSHATVVLPIMPDGILSFLSQGERLGGIFELSQATNDEPVDVDGVATVYVDAFHRVQNALDDVTLAHIQPTENTEGVGLYRTRGRLFHTVYDHSLWFRIHVRLPATDFELATPLNIHSFTTQLTLFSHQIFHLPYTEIESVSMKSANGVMTVEALTSSMISLSTINGPIRGSFKASEELSLETTNAPIVANISLKSSAEVSLVKAVLRTINGSIHVSIELATPPARRPNSTFDILAQTANAPLTATLTTNAGAAPAVPGGARLKGTFTTANAPVQVTLPRTFAGAFNLHGFPFLQPSVREQPCTSNGRFRRVERANAGYGQVVGRVVWDPAGLEVGREGSVSVQTTNAPLQLML